MTNSHAESGCLPGTERHAPHDAAPLTERRIAEAHCARSDRPTAPQGIPTDPRAVVRVTDAHTSRSKHERVTGSGLSFATTHHGVALAARQGRGLEARVLRGKDPLCNWTHLGLALQLPGSGAWEVIHADPGQGRDGRVRQECFASFCAQAEHACLMRLPVATSEAATRLRDEALRYVGVPFDGSYDWTRADALYCTSLLWRVFNAAGIPAPQPPFPSFVLPVLGTRELILPGLFTKSTGDIWF